VDTKIKNLRRPIIQTINGQPVTLLTVGYVSRALGRTKWTVKNWTRLGLLPPAPFLLRPDVPNTRRYLYPHGFVKCLAEIARQPYVIRRLDRSDWGQFHHEVSRAYEQTVTPLLAAGVTASMDSDVGEGEGRQAIYLPT
jgi:hypothetical protein